MFMHNGAFQGFRQKATRPLRDSLSDEAHARLLSVTDSETIFAGLLDRLGEGTSLDAALAATIRHLSAMCAVAVLKATPLNLCGDGRRVNGLHPPLDRGAGQLALLHRGRRGVSGAVVVASERLDTDAGWRKVPDRHLLTVDHEGGATLRSL